MGETDRQRDTDIETDRTQRWRETDEQTERQGRTQRWGKTDGQTERAGLCSFLPQNLSGDLSEGTGLVGEHYHLFQKGIKNDKRDN